ncbi:MAG: polymer-forming cytoskeletal protein [Chloroflexi bacterium]|nr:polymer-forming cytoskeletal protein [Chloroflexota bacterium]
MFKGDGYTAEAVANEGKETILTRTTDFEGKLKADGPVKIYGMFNGEIETAGTVVVGKAAMVTATISAKDVAVAGTVRGNVTAAGRLEIFSGGKVYGNIASAALRIEEGGLFSGQSLMQEQRAESQLFKAPAAELKGQTRE